MEIRETSRPLSPFVFNHDLDRPSNKLGAERARPCVPNFCAERERQSLLDLRRTSGQFGRADFSSGGRGDADRGPSLGWQL
jgi:hypothetical protein